MDYLLTLTLLLVVFYSVYRYFINKGARFVERGVPCVYGNFKTLFRLEHVTDAMMSIYNKYPEAKYIGSFDFTRPMIMLRDLDLIKSVAIKNFDSFPNHFPLVDVSLDPLFAGILFSLTGERWKEMRNSLSPAFTASKMKAMQVLIVECAQNMVEYLSQLPEQASRMMDTKELFTKFSNDVIATCAFGISINSMKDPNNEFYVLGRSSTSFDGLMGLKFIFFRMFPGIAKLLGMRLFPKRVADFFENVVETTVKTRLEKGITRPDMIQLMMKASENDKMDISSMTANAFGFFLGGFETISNQMCAMAHELAINPDVQKRLQEEIDEVMKKSDGNPSYEDVQAMLYLDAVFNETMRRHSALFVLDRVCVKTFELPPATPTGKSFTLQPGDGVWIPLSIHMDPKYYENPKKFDPDRYYEKKVTINDVTNLGFGIGPRSCIANRFAAMQMKNLIVHLLANFNLRANEKTCSPYVYSKASFSSKPVGGFWLAVEPRKSIK